MRMSKTKESSVRSSVISPCRLQMLLSLAGRLTGVGSSASGTNGDVHSDADTTASVHSEDRPESKDRDLCYIEHVIFSTYEIKCWLVVVYYLLLVPYQRCQRGIHMYIGEPKVSKPLSTRRPLH